ncbi:MAG: alpha-hydroxy-acid oxidizing protein [Acetobacteraceae bacterium]|nr:alpha-hydroxy-acid oxidizing protein [Acetobacteraceae bacterium]
MLLASSGVSSPSAIATSTSLSTSVTSDVDFIASGQLKRTILPRRAGHMRSSTSLIATVSPDLASSTHLRPTDSASSSSSASSAMVALLRALGGRPLGFPLMPLTKAIFPVLSLYFQAVTRPICKRSARNPSPPLSLVRLYMFGDGIPPRARATLGTLGHICAQHPIDQRGAGLPKRVRASRLRLAWDGMIRPDWTLNTFLRTLLKHGMPHFENSYATRGAPILAKSVMRDFGAKDHLNWRHLEMIRQRWKGRLVIKGIMSKEDACIARDSGVQGIVVSNHGGRQLDGAVSPLRVLPAIADAVGSTIAVMMDGGIRRGSGVLKAIALGAKFVFVGRPFIYAAAIGGEAGVSHAINILSAEINRNMGLLGINSLREMQPDLLLRLKWP